MDRIWSGGDVEFVGGFEDRDLALADEIRHELQHQRGAVGRDERAATGHAALPCAASRARSSRRDDLLRRARRGSTTRTSGPYEASSSAKMCTSTYEHADALLGGRRAPAQPQCRLGAGIHLEQGGVAGGDLLEPREGAIPAPSRSAGSKDCAGDLDRPDDAREQEGAVGRGIQVVCRRRATATRSRRGRAAAAAAAAGASSPGLRYGNVTARALLDRPLQRPGKTGRGG